IAEEVAQHEPGVAAPLADTAVGDDVVTLLEARLFLVDGPKLVSALELPGLGVHGARPGDALRGGDVAAADGSFLRVLGHVQLEALELVRAADVDELPLLLEVLEHIFAEGADLRIVAPGDGIVRRGDVWRLGGKGTTLVLPLLTAPVHHLHLVVAEETED